MARIEHIKRRLDNWAMWRVRRDSNGLGFASTNILAVWMASAGEVSKTREVKIPVLHLEAEETDQAVQALRLGKGHLHVTLGYIYLRDLGVQETARRMNRAPSTIHAQLEQADRWIDAWLRAQHEIKEKAQGRV
jgi:hypothetical protein